MIANKPKSIDKKQIIEIIEASIAFDIYGHFGLSKNVTIDAGYRVDVIEDFIYVRYGIEDDYMYVCLCLLKAWDDEEILTIIMKLATNSGPLYKYWSQRIFNGKDEQYCKIVTEELNQTKNRSTKQRKKNKKK